MAQYNAVGNTVVDVYLKWFLTSVFCLSNYAHCKHVFEIKYLVLISN